MANSQIKSVRQKRGNSNHDSKACQTPWFRAGLRAQGNIMKEGLIINAALINNLDEVDEFQARVTEENHFLVRKKLEDEKTKAVNILKEMEMRGEIKSIFIPRERGMMRDKKLPMARRKPTQLQKKINKIVKVKKSLKESIEKIMEFYCR